MSATILIIWKDIKYTKFRQENAIRFLVAI